MADPRTTPTTSKVLDLTDLKSITPKLMRSEGMHWHYCPGCATLHPLPDSWTFDDNLVTPTFNPSFMQRFGHTGNQKQCHYFIRAGMIEYCGDSHHALAGYTVEMPDVPEERKF